MCEPVLAELVGVLGDALGVDGVLLAAEELGVGATLVAARTPPFEKANKRSTTFAKGA